MYRSDLITDRDVLAAVDAQLAAQVTRWPSMTQGRLIVQIDKVVGNPGDAVPEPGYVPSKALADFVPCRDLTWR